MPDRSAPEKRPRGSIAGLLGWCFLGWVLLTWTATVEVFATGALVALGCALLLAPLGGLPGPWHLLAPRRLGARARLLVLLVTAVARANLHLARRIWSPRLAPRSGMIVLPTRMRGESQVAAVGVLTSLVVDNQLVDVDLATHRLLYHCIEVPADQEGREAVNGAVERRLLDIEGTR
jgi:multicomponent Na+:H+ antiporter subunit E